MCGARGLGGLFRGGGRWHIYIIFLHTWVQNFFILLSQFSFIQIFFGDAVLVAAGVSLAWSFRAAGGGICWAIGPLFRFGLLVRSQLQL